MTKKALLGLPRAMLAKGDLHASIADWFRTEAHADPIASCAQLHRRCRRHQPVSALHSAVLVLSPSLVWDTP